jgi:histidinol-phosphate aminotransferase
MQPSLSLALAETRSSGNGPIYLNRNENAYGPSEKVRAAMAIALANANRYPAAGLRDLSGQIAAYHNVQSSQVLAGCGSTDLLRMAAAAFLGPGKSVLMASPTFEALGAYAATVGAAMFTVPLNREYAHDCERMAGRSGSETGLVYICNPNNPTGSLTPRKDLEWLINKLPGSSYILIDEAYHDFAGESQTYTSFISRPVGDRRVIVLRTFSKIHGLAGLRVGYAVAAPDVIERIRAYQIDNAVNVVAAQAAIAALTDTEGLRLAAKRNADDRQEFVNQAHARSLKPIDSHTNFVMTNTGRDVAQVIEHFQKHGVYVARRFPAMPEHLRVALGTPAEMRQFLRVWDLMPPGPKMMH